MTFTRLISAPLIFKKWVLAGLIGVTASVMNVRAQQPSAAPSPEFAPGGGMTTVSAVSGDYSLRSNDLIAVTVFGEPEMSVQDRLSGDGTVMLPLLGRVKLAGKTSTNAAEAIRQLLAADYLVNPQVSVAVVDYTKDFFTILGQVNSPGQKVLPPTGNLSFLQAIGMASGYTRLASLRAILIERKIPGREEVIKVDGKTGRRIGSGRHNSNEEIQIMPGDVITVDERLF